MVIEMTKHVLYFKLFVFMGYLLIGTNTQAMNTEFDEKQFSSSMLMKFGGISDYEKEKVSPNLTINFTFFPDYEDNKNQTLLMLSFINLYKNSIKSEEILKKTAMELLENANKYKMTAAYQTKELRQLSNKNFFYRCLLLKSASILYDKSKAKMLWKDDKESTKYSVECCDAFLSADEVVGITYSTQEESDIQQFFSNQLNYMENIEKLVSDLK